MIETTFAAEEFGSASLGDKRRNKRLQMIAAQASIAPAGRLTDVFKSGAAREASYRFVENEDVDPNEIRIAAARTAFGRARGEPYVFVPIDGTSLTLPSVPSDSDLGPIGNRWSKELGVHVMNGIVVSPEGVPLGTAAQIYWARERQEQLSRTNTYVAGKKGNRVRRDTQRPIGEKESAHWGAAMEQAHQAAHQAGFLGMLWFQLDAGADFAHLLVSATLMQSWVTVRSKNPRTLFQEEGTLLEKVVSSALLGTLSVEVPQTNNRAGRTATLELRYVPVVLKLKPRGEGGTVPGPLFAVHAREISHVPKGDTPIDWMLLTNKPGRTFADAKEVVRAYSTRWRIEEVHKTWKSVTKVEESALTSVNAISIWATILFSVAIRIERLKYFSRSEPNAPASVELSQPEIETLQSLREAENPTSRQKAPLRGPITIGVAVRWIADLGGYMNPHQGPPGSITVARGLRYLRIAVHAQSLRKL